jgi:hypothetical protein
MKYDVLILPNLFDGVPSTVFDVLTAEQAHKKYGRL